MSVAPKGIRPSYGEAQIKYYGVYFYSNDWLAFIDCVTRFYIKCLLLCQNTCNKQHHEYKYIYNKSYTTIDLFTSCTDLKNTVQKRSYIIVVYKKHLLSNNLIQTIILTLLICIEKILFSNVNYLHYFKFLDTFS